jgi:hypothetical protein
MGWEKIGPNQFEARVDERCVTLVRAPARWYAWTPLHRRSTPRTAFDADSLDRVMAAVCAWYAGHGMPEMAAAVHALGVPEDA